MKWAGKKERSAERQGDVERDILCWKNCAVFFQKKVTGIFVGVGQLKRETATEREREKEKEAGKICKREQFFMLAIQPWHKLSRVNRLLYCPFVTRITAHLIHFIRFTHIQAAQIYCTTKLPKNARVALLACFFSSLQQLLLVFSFSLSLSLSPPPLPSLVPLPFSLFNPMPFLISRGLYSLVCRCPSLTPASSPDSFFFNFNLSIDFVRTDDYRFQLFIVHICGIFFSVDWRMLCLANIVHTTRVTVRMPNNSLHHTTVLQIQAT